MRCATKRANMLAVLAILPLSFPTTHSSSYAVHLDVFFSCPRSIAVYFGQMAIESLLLPTTKTAVFIRARKGSLLLLS